MEFDDLSFSAILDYAQRTRRFSREIGGGCTTRGQWTPSQRQSNASVHKAVDGTVIKERRSSK
jgi:hypothetical protein